MFPFVKRGFTQEEFRAYVEGLNWTSWRPSKIVWHNTAAPTMAQWIKSANEDKAQGRKPGISRINSLESFYENNQGWNGGPHLFIAPGGQGYEPLIWVANSLTARGTHSPSFNATAIGIEMIGDFSKEDDRVGPGLQVKQSTIFATAVLCSALGLDPFRSILLHKEDPKTTHDCPGKNIAQDKTQMISAVMSLMEAGDHPVGKSEKPIEPEVALRTVEVTADNLNFRKGPGVSNPSTGSVPRGTVLTVLAEAQNANDKWLKVRSPAGYIGWVSGRYTKEIPNA